jgi:hypothetical protein
MTALSDISGLLAQRSLLLAAAARDRRLTAVDVRVAVLLLDQIHRKTGPRFGLMWPSVAALAQCAACHLIFLKLFSTPMRHRGPPTASLNGS